MSVWLVWGACFRNQFTNMFPSSVWSVWNFTRTAVEYRRYYLHTVDRLQSWSVLFSEKSYKSKSCYLLHIYRLRKLGNSSQDGSRTCCVFYFPIGFADSIGYSALVGRCRSLNVCLRKCISHFCIATNAPQLKFHVPLLYVADAWITRSRASSFASYPSLVPLRAR